jgi:nucleotide-binding universal stress UspA family protein
MPATDTVKVESMYDWRIPMSVKVEANGFPQIRRRAVEEIMRLSPKHRDTPLILLGTQGRPDDDTAIRTLWTACGMFNPENAVLRIVHVLTVPMTAPLDVSIPEAEAASARMLRRAHVLARATGAIVQTATLRGRTVAEALVDDARRTRASAIIVRLRSRETAGAHVLLSLTVRALLRDAPCSVVILHLPHVRNGVHAEAATPGISNNGIRPSYLSHR